MITSFKGKVAKVVEDAATGNLVVIKTPPGAAQVVAGAVDHAALEGVIGDQVLTAAAPGFASGFTTVSVVQPFFSLQGLGANIDTLDPDDAFLVTVGLPNGSFTGISQSQNARQGGPGITATVTNSAGAVGQLAAWAERFTSFVVAESDDALLLEVAGSLRLFGGVGRIRCEVRRGLASKGLTAALALAPTPLATSYASFAKCTVAFFDASTMGSIGVSAITPPV